jgi:hypothetical protein
MKHFYESLDGYFWFQEAYRRMLDTLPLDRPSAFVEIGSYQGKSAAYLGVEILNRQLPCTLHCVDSWELDGALGDGPTHRAAFDRNMARLALELGDRLQVHALPSVNASALFSDRSLDVVWIDGDHEYAGVTADIQAWFPKVKSGGWIGGDDFMMLPTARAVCDAFAPTYILVHGWATQPEPMPWPSWLQRRA